MERKRETDTTHRSGAVIDRVLGPCARCLEENPQTRYLHFLDYARTHGLDAFEAHYRETLRYRIHDLARVNDYVTSVVKFVKDHPGSKPVVPDMT